MKFDRKGKRESEHSLQWLFFQEEVQADDKKRRIQRIHLTPVCAIDEDCREDEKQAGCPIGLTPRGIFDTYDAVHKIRGDAIEEDREQFDGGNPGKDGVEESCAGKEVPKRRRVSDEVLSKCNRNAVIQDVLIPYEVEIGHVPGDLPGKQPCQHAQQEKRS